MSSEMITKLVDMRNITKYIYDDDGKGIVSSGVKILDDVGFDLQSGEVHVLIGENGAGKSTLMNILGGVIEPDSGEVWIDGQRVRIQNTKVALRHGIGFIHQEMNLCTNLDIAHNIFMSREIRNSLFITDDKKMYHESERMLRDLGFSINPKTRIGNLSTAMQQIVEIAKVLSYNSRIVIMDEPTSTLTSHEIEILFGLIRSLREKGIGIIYISHRMEEIEDLGDRFTILRDGLLVKTIAKIDYKRSECIRLMAGKEVSESYPKTHCPSDETVLDVKDIQLGKNTRPFSFHINKGEVVGFGGLVGAGRTELAKSIFGTRDFFNGTIFFNGGVYNKPSPAKSIEKGISYLTEDRKLEGLVLQKAIDENISITSIYRLFPNRLIKKSKEKKLATEIVTRFNVICTSIKQRAGNLSGGNQQKVSLGKWYATDPVLFMLDEPTRGIDVNAKRQIYEIIDNSADAGMAIMVITSDIHELIGISDRIYIMHEGNLVTEIREKKKMTQENLLTYFLDVGEDKYAMTL
jgi:ABC-type sugar transport system ATPase subunit